jgi:UDP-4-amino-4-deoxy-L-arabinose formyltransferase/UDP-glucuronic acid dehydrogenase (UDP-4-keto-hexauronic acid decarboxylating)
VSKVAIVGCKSTTRYLFEQVSGFLPISAVVTIAPDLAARQEVAGYDDLTDLPATEIYTARRYALTAAEDLAYFQERQFDLLLVAGWQRIIPKEILETVRNGAYGMHGSSRDLPFGRGRSPMNWSLIEGRQWFFTNLFRYLPGVDDGPIADTACFSINPADTAETLHFKNLLAMVHLVRKNAEGLLRGQVDLREQPRTSPTYYPKRNPDDGLIDWSSDVFAIERLVRAVAQPFSGAFAFLEGARLTIQRAAIFYTDIEEHPYRGEAPGTICAVLPNGKFCVRCVGGVLLAHDYRFERGGVPPEGAQLDAGGREVRLFPRNGQGYFDIGPEPAR